MILAKKIQFTLFMGLITWAGVYLWANAETTPSFALITEPVPLYAGDTAIVTIEPDNFTASSTMFTWFLNNILISSASGKGGNSIKIQTAKGKSEIFVIRALVDPGTGFEPTERQYIVATTYIPTPAEIYNTQSQIRSSFKITASPSSPSPGQTVKLSIDAFGFDANFSKIQWFINDNLVASGIGERRTEITVGDVGRAYAVRADITLPDGTTNSEILLLQVSNLALYWWTNTVVPPWYKGKALPATGAQVSVLALPDFNKVPPTNLSYKWEFNAGPMKSLSGFNKTTFTFNSLFEGIRDVVGVTVSNMTGTQKKSTEISIASRAPRINFYRLKPLEGVDYAQSIKNLEAPAGTTLDIIAQLFHLPQKFRDSLNFSWKLNGIDVSLKESTSPNILTIRSEEGIVPNQHILLTITNMTRSVGEISNFFRLQYR